MAATERRRTIPGPRAVGCRNVSDASCAIVMFFYPPKRPGTKSRRRAYNTHGAQCLEAANSCGFLFRSLSGASRVKSCRRRGRVLFRGSSVNRRSIPTRPSNLSSPGSGTSSLSGAALWSSASELVPDAVAARKTWQALIHGCSLRTLAGLTMALGNSIRLLSSWLREESRAAINIREAAPISCSGLRLPFCSVRSVPRRSPLKLDRAPLFATN